MTKRISRRRIPSRNIRQIAQPPEIATPEVNAAPPNAQNDDYHSEIDWSNDDFVNQAEFVKKLTKMSSRAMKLTELTLTSRPKTVESKWLHRLELVLESSIEQIMQESQFYWRRTQGSHHRWRCNSVTFYQSIFWRSYDEDFCWRSKRVYCINWSKC